MLKISILTAVYNRKDSIAEAILSVKKQTYPNIEQIIIDGASTDGTAELILDLLSSSDQFVSEPDKGIYDALNKGLARATGDIIGLVHSDDFFADDNVLADVAKAFLENPDVDLIYGDLEYVAKDNTQHVIRHWKSKPFEPALLNWGWMPAHPTVFIRRRLYEKVGGYHLVYRISADYDWCIRCLKQPGLKALYIPRVLVKMRTGGESNGSLKKVINRTQENLAILRKNRVGALGGLWPLFWKNFSKIKQFLPHKD